MNYVIILLMASAFFLTRVTNLRTAVIVLLVQSVVVALACVVIGLEAGNSHYYLAALLTVIIKAIIIPAALFRILRKMKREKEVDSPMSANLSSLAAVVAIALAYNFMNKALPGIISRDALAASVALVLIGLQVIMIRRQAVLQIVGLNIMENGLYLLGLSVTKGLPLIIELGIFFDVLIAVGILGLLTYRLKLSYQSTDTSVLEKLKG